MSNINPELSKIQEQIEKIAKAHGLDFFPTVFEMVTHDQMNALAAYGGFPTRYPHWRFGMEYERLSKSYTYGLSKIYEMVINNDPCYAYLMESNPLVDQKLVMAHVYGHCDFFKNNKWFSSTNRHMIDQMANHATRVKRYVDHLGYDIVEEFIDRCLSLENLVDRHSPYIKRPREEREYSAPKTISERVEKDFMESFKDPMSAAALKEDQRQADKNKNEHTPQFPEMDILLYLMDHAPLEAWQRDVLSIVRDEAYYFAPQGMTKIMNEGWASYWHSKIMTGEVLSDTEIVDYADHHSGTVASQPGKLNPYKVGIELFKDIEERWNKGQFGREWEECTDFNKKQNWDKKLGQGKKKIFEVRRDMNDVMFIDAFLTEEFCVRHKLFVLQFNQRTGQYEINTRNFPQIKKQLLFQLTNFGQPIIKVIDGNYEGRGELFLDHLHEGVDLQPNYMDETLKNLFTIWGKPIWLKTVMDGQGKTYKFDGAEVKEQ